MARKKQNFLHEDEDYEWVEHSGRHWIFFGGRYHFWRLTHKRHGSVATELGNLEYEHVKSQQLHNPYKAATFETYDKDEKRCVPGWNFYWFVNKLYLVDYSFPEEHVKNLIEQYHVDAKELKEKKIANSKTGIQSEIDRISRNRNEP